MKTQDIKNIALALKNIREAMDPVNPKELKGKHKDRKDKDIDNDGDVDSTDKYLHKRRKAVSKAIASKKKPSGENDSNVEVQTSEAVLDEAPRKKRAPQIKHSVDPFKAERERNRAHDAAMGRTPTGRKKPERTMNSTQRQLAAIRAKMANEAVEIRHDRYMRSHGKKAKDPGHSSGWFFTHKNMGHINNYDDPKEVHFHQGRFADAKKSAQKWAKSHGHSTVYVMEEVEQIDEISQEKLRKYEIENEKDRERLSKKIGWIRNNKPTSQQKKDIAKLKSRNDMSTMSSKKRYPSVWQGKNAARVPATESTLDEVSKKTLGSYIKKAAKDMEKRGIRQGNPQASIAWVDKHSQKADKRAKGIARAVDKMAKEEVNLDEAETTYVIKHKKTKQVLSTHSNYNDAKDEHSGISDKQNYGVFKQTKKDAALRNRNTYREEVELDEVTVANATKAFDIKKQALALKRKIARLRDTPGDGAHMKMIAAKKTFDKKIAALQALDLDAAEIKKLKEEVNLDEVSSTTMQRYKSKAGKIIDTSTDEKEIKKRSKGYTMASKKLTNRIMNKEETVAEAIAPKGTHKPDNGSDPQQGLSPNAKKMMAMKTDAPEGADITKVAPKTFAAMRASGKKAAMRNNDNPQGDKTPPKNDGK